MGKESQPDMTTAHKHVHSFINNAILSAVLAEYPAYDSVCIIFSDLFGASLLMLSTAILSHLS